MTRSHTLDCDVVHYSWDNATAPRLVIDPGDTVVMKCRDSSDNYYKRGMTAADPKPPPAKGHPLTGPIAVRGARHGDALRIDILELVPGDIGHTAFGPGRDFCRTIFPSATSRCGTSTAAGRSSAPGIRIPLEPFLGVMGVALAEPGEHSTIPPRKSGGNMDIKQLTAGTTLYLPIAVDGALFSAAMVTPRRAMARSASRPSRRP